MLNNYMMISKLVEVASFISKASVESCELRRTNRDQFANRIRISSVTGLVNLVPLLCQLARLTIARHSSEPVVNDQVIALTALST